MYNLTYLIIFAYSLSFPLESFHLLYITDASTLAGENVFGSFSKDMILSNIVLKNQRRSYALNKIWQNTQMQSKWILKNKWIEFGLSRSWTQCTSTQWWNCLCIIDLVRDNDWYKELPIHRPTLILNDDINFNTFYKKLNTQLFLLVIKC